ncbi:complex I NDUFA9 subunit family protein [Chelativorans salis]|uniref:Complex I NDUFA9 subunit family protein n=1 Tax=Chelativorans salis TaxID=2978478 RepID=A0ABT2LSF7_9HYPH|nr:complex I NDUFA9 subunit family protein [Chelativorans sp. EGI FJ00035]MCT7377409.1 complex I NDUFA9 subunit family protein [Chelativorans sp. EGI FJ00035]
MARTKREARSAVVLGGTGFLGRRIVRHLLECGFKVRSGSRHPERAHSIFGEAAVEAVRADVTDELSLNAALARCANVVNAVSLYVEHGELTFDAIHVRAAARVARVARDVGISQLVHISGIGSDPLSNSDYISARGRGENAVREAFPGVTIIRPAVMVGPDDAFLTTVARLARLSPVYPLFGSGKTRLQPVHVEDVAEAVARVLDRRDSAPCYELGGPRVYLYRELVKTIARQSSAHTLPVPMPFVVWSVMARLAEQMPSVPLTRNQVELMRHDNVAAADFPGFEQLGIEPAAVEDVVQKLRDRETER